MSFTADGDYVLHLVASDTVFQVTDTVAISVAAGNHAPFVSAGPDRPLPPGEFTTTLTGEIDDDGIPGGPVLAAWSQVSGPGAASFGSPHAASSTVALDGPGVYVLRLTASDTMLARSDDVTVHVGATAPTGPVPTASLTSPVSGVSLGQPTMVRGSVGSATLAGWRLEHRLAGEGPWTLFGFGTTIVTNADLAAFDPTLLLNGLYEIRLVATDAAGRSAQATTQVVVRDNFKVGHFTVSFVDMEVPVAGMAIQVGRTYDSRDKRMGDFGVGWRLDLSNVRVEETGTAGLSWVGHHELRPGPDVLPASTVAEGGGGHTSQRPRARVRYRDHAVVPHVRPPGRGNGQLSSEAANTRHARPRRRQRCHGGRSLAGGRRQRADATLPGHRLRTLRSRRIRAHAA